MTDKKNLSRRLLQALITSAGLLLLWQSVIWFTGIPPYILPSPYAVGKKLWLMPTQLAYHAGITLLEIALSLLIATIIGVLTALALTYSHFIRRWLQPILLITQAIPVYALAPIFMLWFGYGLFPKVLITTIILFFPITTAAYDGLTHTPRGQQHLAKTLNATTWRNLVYLRLPAALPQLGSGLRIGAAIAPIGAIVGEYIGGSAGLGYLMQYGIHRSQTDLAFAALSIITLLTLMLYHSVDALLKRYIYW